MTEFQKLSEVEKLETASENASVLVEEGGEIKRVPKKEVGGAGGYVIKLENSRVDDDGFYCFDESYDDLYAVLMAGGSVWVDYTNAPEQSVQPMSTFASNDYHSLDYATNFGAFHVPVAAWALTDMGLYLGDFATAMRNGASPNIHYPNGSHNLPPQEGGGEE